MNFKVLAMVAASAVTVPILLAFGGTSALAEDLKASKTKELSFSYPPEWGTVEVTKVKASPLMDKGDIPDGVAPEHLECRFSKSKNACIYIYPVKDANTPEFKKKFGVVSEAVNDLKKAIKSHPAKESDIPYLPWQDAGDPINAQVKYNTAKDRSYVRFVTQRTGSPGEINNTDLQYSSQSLTNDGKSYIAAWLPVAAEGLPATDGATKMAAAKYKQFSAGYAGYLKTQLKKLNGMGDSAFKPSLATLDKVSESIVPQ